MTSMDGWFSLAGVVFTVFILIAAFQAWCLWRVRRALEALLPLQQRVTRLNYSLGLLVDTTQGCFDALAAQVAQRGDVTQPSPAVTASRPAGQTATQMAAASQTAAASQAAASQAAASQTASQTASRQQRQRRVVGAAKRGRTVAQIAAEEAVAEGEVALRMQMARELQASCELA